MLLTPTIYVRYKSFNNPYEIGQDTLRAVSLRKAFNESFAKLTKGKIEWKEYYNQNQYFQNELYWFMQNAATKVLDTNYLHKKKFDVSHLRKPTILLQLTHLNYTYRGNIYSKDFTLYIQVLVLNEQNHIVFYNINWVETSGYDNLDITLPNQLSLVLQPFFDNLEKIKKEK